MPITPDPVRTQITAPSTNYVPEAAPNRTEETRQLNLGVNAIGKMFGDLANREKQRQIASDVMVAENAAIRGELLPGTLLPVAVDAYNKAVDNIAANEMLVEHEVKRSSKEYVSVIDDPSITTDVKNKAVDAQRATTFARAAQYITDPDVLLSLSNKLSAGALVDKKLVIEAESNQRNLVMIKQIQNKIKNNDSIISEEIDDTDGVLSFKSQFNAKWIDETAAELGEYNAYVPEHLRKLLAFKVLAKSSNAVENPNIIHNLLLEEYSPGFTYGNLLLATGDDAEEHLKTYTTFLTQSAQYATATRVAETARVKKERIDLMNGLSAQGDANAVLTSALTVPDKNTVLTAISKYNSNQPKIEINSNAFLSYKEKIITGKLKFTKATLEHHGYLAGFSTEAVGLLQQYLTEEGQQLVDNEKVLVDVAKTFDQNLISLGKTKLFQDGELLAIIKKAGSTGWTQELRDRLTDKTVPAAVQAALIEQVSDFRRDMAVIRGRLAQEAANQNNQSGSLSEKTIETYSKQWNERFRNVAEGIEEKHFLKMAQDKTKFDASVERLARAKSDKEARDAEAVEKANKKNAETKENKSYLDTILDAVGNLFTPSDADAAPVPGKTAFKSPETKAKLLRVKLEAQEAAAEESRVRVEAQEVAAEASRVRVEAFKETGRLKVSAGDTVTRIADRYEMTATEVEFLNGGTDEVFADRDIIVSSELRSRLADFQDIPASVDVNRFEDLKGPIHKDNPKRTKLDYAKKISTQINPLLKSVFSSYKGILSSVKSDRKEAADLKGEHGTFALDYSLKEHFTKGNLVSESQKAIKVFKNKGFTITKTNAGADFHKQKTRNKHSKKKELSQVWFKMTKDNETYTFEFTSRPSHIHIAPDMDERYKQHWPKIKRTNPDDRIL